MSNEETSKFKAQIDEWQTKLDELKVQSNLLKMEYREDGGGAEVSLSWEPPGAAKVIIPTTALGTASDADGDGVPDDCAFLDCNDNGVHDVEDVASGFGSGSFVSPRGLILTSNRCVRDAVAVVLDADGHTRADDPPSIIKAGFVAATPEQEIRLRTPRDGWLTAAQLIRVSDVTDEVNRGVAPTDDEVQIKEKADRVDSLRQVFETQLPAGEDEAE